jgi:WhiB family transcriptional regulator, redox-sensing transcriptional regulator
VNRRREIQWADKTAGAALHLAGADDRDPDWQDYAACKDADPELFFPPMGGSTDQAKAICGRCFVRAECLDYALDHGSWGVWGGVSFYQGRPLDADLRAANPPRSRKDPAYCPSGKHRRTEANTHEQPAGRTICRLCESERGRKRYQDQKEVMAS